MREILLRSPSHVTLELRRGPRKIVMCLGILRGWTKDRIQTGATWRWSVLSCPCCRSCWAPLKHEGRSWFQEVDESNIIADGKIAWAQWASGQRANNSTSLICFQVEQKKLVKLFALNGGSAKHMWTYFTLLLHVFVTRVHMPRVPGNTCIGQSTTFGSWVSPTLWVPGTEFRPLTLAAGALMTTLYSTGIHH